MSSSKRTIRTYETENHTLDQANRTDWIFVLFGQGPDLAGNISWDRVSSRELNLAFSIKILLMPEDSDLCYPYA